MISAVSCAVPARGPKLSGASNVRFTPGSLLARCYAAESASEEYFCNYEVNPAYEERLLSHGLRATARGDKNEIRAVELEGHPFFLATLFQPQMSSEAGKPNPIMVAFLSAAREFSKTKRPTDHR